MQREESSEALMNVERKRRREEQEGWCMRLGRTGEEVEGRRTVPVGGGGIRGALRPGWPAAVAGGGPG